MSSILSIHQIEMTSHCNLRCRYCPSPHLGRPKEHMTDETYAQALNWASYFVKRGTQFELNLAGIGESTMHPKFAHNVKLAREAVGPSVLIALATNGLLITDELVREIAPYKPAIWVSLHRPEKGGPAIEILKRYGLLHGVSNDPAMAAINWAGQVNWHVSTGRSPCPWVKGGRVMVMADGRITACCLDADGSGVLGHIDQDLTQIKTRAYKLCATCHHDVGVPIPEQEAAHAI